MSSDSNVSNTISQTQRNVGISRVLRLPWLVGLGATVTVGLGVYTLLGVYLDLSPEQTAGAYLLMVIIALPLILTYAERAAVISGSGGAYNLARMGEIGWLAYLSGWIMIGGYACLMALLGLGIALHLNLLWERLFAEPLDLPLLAAAAIGILVLNNLFGPSRIAKTRGTVVSIGIIVLAYIIIRNLFARTPEEEQAATIFFFSPTSITSLAALMMSSLWGLYLILNVRDSISRPGRRIMPALLYSTLLGGVLGLLAGVGVLRYPSLIRNTFTPIVDIVFLYQFVLSPDLLTVFYAVFGVLIISIALNHSIIGSLKLLGAMTQDGFFSEKIQTMSEYRAPAVPLILGAIFSILLVLYTPVLTLVGLAAITLLWSTALVHIPDLFRKQPNLPEERHLKLPFHPLLPGLTVAIGLLLPFTVTNKTWPFGLAWLLLGGLYYAFYARRGGMEVRRRDVLVRDTTPASAETGTRYHIMVGVANPKTAPSLIQAGAKLARARKGDLLVLRVFLLPAQLPVQAARETAHKEWEFLAKLIQEVGLEDVTAKPLVRVAPNPAAGILETAREEGVGLVLLGWPGAGPTADMNVEPVVEAVIGSAPCDVAVLRGRLPEHVKRVMVPTDGGPHASMALRLGLDLAEPDDRQILVVNLVDEHLTAGLEAEAQTHLSTTVAAAKNGHNIEQRIREVDTVKEGILTEAEACDLLLMGASKEGFMGKSTVEGLPSEVVYGSAKPTIVARRRERYREFWLRRAWEIITGPLPALTASRREEVVLQMRQSAQPNVDFFVLILLSATIATVGLLQNSAAVIIGAMLVAPLMSPILSMGMSLVQGNLNQLRIAAEATSKGITLAIVLGIVVTLISPFDQPTSEILGRTAPNILDLMVAVASGAAAAYAISRKEVAAALPGVAIAAALVPPLCVVGYGLGASDLDIAAGSSLLFITNLVAIVFSSALTFLALGFHPILAEREEAAVRSQGLKIAVVSLAIIAVILTLTTISSVQQFNRQQQVESVLEQLVKDKAIVQGVKVERSKGDGFNITATFIVFEVTNMTEEEVDDLEAKLTEAAGGPVTVDATILVGRRATLRDGE